MEFIDPVTPWVWALGFPYILALIAFFMLVLFIYVLSVIVGDREPGPNPFKADTRRAPGPIETDHAARDKVLKQAFHTKRIPENIDAIVVGSGIGGLGAAAILSRAGKKVLVLEQHDQAGGCCHTFVEKGFEFDVGIHYIGEMRNNTVSRLLVEQVTDGQLVWEDIIDDLDLVVIGEPGKQKSYPWKCSAGGYEAWKEQMLKSFPSDEKALDKYIKLLKSCRRSMMGHISLKFMSKWMARILINTGLIHKYTDYFTYGQKSAEEVVKGLTDNKDLQAVLTYSFGDYGTLPRHGTFAMHAALVNHYIQGGSYPKGGASEIAFHAIPVIEKSGGKVLVRAKVSEILFDNKGRANGVRVSKSGGSVDVYAPLIISDAGAVNTLKSLLPQEIAVKSGINRLIVEKKINSGVGAMSLFVGLKGTTEELGVKGQHVWAFTSNDTHNISEEYLNLPAQDAAESDVPLLFVTFPSAKDSTYQQRFPGKSVCTVITLANWDWFKDWEDDRVMKRGHDYTSIKDGIGRRMWNQVLALYPQLEDKVEYFNVGSPLSNKYYINSPKGEIYGLDHDLKRFAPEAVMTLRPDIDIPGLLLTGQDVLSAGFIGALFGGLLCASRALNRNCYEDLVNLKKNIAKTK